MVLSQNNWFQVVQVKLDGALGTNPVRQRVSVPQIQFQTGRTWRSTGVKRIKKGKWVTEEKWQDNMLKRWVHPPRQSYKISIDWEQKWKDALFAGLVSSLTSFPTLKWNEKNICFENRNWSSPMWDFWKSVMVLTNGNNPPTWTLIVSRSNVCQKTLFSKCCVVYF